MKKRKFGSVPTLSADAAIRDTIDNVDSKLYMLAPASRARYLLWRETQLKRLNPEAKKTLDLFAVEPGFEISYPQTPMKNDHTDLQLSRTPNLVVDRDASAAAAKEAIAPCGGEASGEAAKKEFIAGTSDKHSREDDVVREGSDFDSPPGSSSKTLDSQGPIKNAVAVDSELSLAGGSAIRKDLENEKKKKKKVRVNPVASQQKKT